jgi:hypothetical protein
METKKISSCQWLGKRKGLRGRAESFLDSENTLYVSILADTFVKSHRMYVTKNEP